MERAARKGFVGMTDFYLQEDASPERCPRRVARGERPKTTAQRAVVLMRHILPGISEAELREMLLARSPQTKSATKTSHDFDVVDGVMDPSDRAAAKETAQRDAEHESNRQAFVSSLGPGSLDLEAAPKPASKAKAKAKATAARGNHEVSLRVAKTPDWVRSYLPQVRGCTATEVPERRSWAVFYPGCVPGSRTRTWGWALSQSALLKHCIEGGLEAPPAKGRRAMPVRLYRVELFS